MVKKYNGPVKSAFFNTQAITHKKLKKKTDIRKLFKKALILITPKCLKFDYLNIANIYF